MIPKRIVALGTSAFFGYGDASGKGGYIGRLKEWHEKKNKDNAVFSLGISGKTVGETTSQLLKRISGEIAIREPDLILLTTGINDVRRHGSKDASCATSQQQFTKNVKEMIDTANQLAHDVMMISVFPTKDKHDSSDNYLLAKDIAFYAQVTKEVCAREKIPYFDIYHEWLQENYDELLFQDGVHANEKGYEKIFERLKEFLQEIYN